MNGLKKGLVFLVTLLLAACGGGGGSGGGSSGGGNTGSGDTSISVAPTQLVFNVMQGNTDAQIVNVSFKGDGVIVGFPVGMTDPGWIFASEISSTTSTASFNISVQAFQSAGSYNTSLRFVTGKEDGTRIKYVDVPVTLNVKVPFSASFDNNAAFTGSKGNPASLAPSTGYSLAISGQDSWTISSDAPWITFSKTTGTGATNVVVKVDVAKAQFGLNTGTFTVKSANEAVGKTFSVSLDLRNAQPVITEQVQFIINGDSAASDLRKALKISDENSGAIAAEAYNWSVKSISAPWLSLSKTSGSTSDSTSPQLVLDQASLGGLNGSLSTAEITLTLSNSLQAAKDYKVVVTASVTFPAITLVAPYVGVAGQANKVVLRGVGLPNDSANFNLTVNGQAVTLIGLDGSTQARVSLPALPAGNYSVKLQNKVGFDVPGVNYVVVPAAGLPTASIASPARRQKLVYDAERARLFAVNRDESSVEVYQLQAGAWITKNSLIVPKLTDISLFLDGSKLLMLSEKAIYTVNLAATNLQPVLAASMTDDWCGIYMDQVEASNNGNFLIVQKYAGCSGYTESATFSPKTNQLTRSNFSVYNGLMDSTIDGSRIYIGGNGLSPAPQVFIYKSLDDSFTGAPVSYNLNDISVGGETSRVILQSTEVYSSSLVLLGSIPQGASVVSRDSSKAYVYRDDDSKPRLEIYNLNGALGAGAVFPLVKTINLDPILSNSSYYFQVKMAETPDGKSLFISGDLRIAVVNLE